MIEKLRSLLTKRDKQFLFGLMIFSILISTIEMVGISAIMPFISVATDFDLIHENRYYAAVYDFFNFESDVHFVVIFGVVLIFFYIFRSLINLLYFYLLAKFAEGRYHLLAYRLFKTYMSMPYQKFLEKNSSTLTKSIISEASNLTNFITAILFMLSELFVVVFIYGMMLYVNYKITFFLTVILLGNTLLMMKTVSKKIKRAGEVRAELQEKFYELINRSFGNFKIIKLHSNRQDILNEFRLSSFGFAQANIVNKTLAQVPRLFLEAVGFGMIIFIITYLIWKYEGNIASALSLVSMFILALYRLMPSVNRIMSSYNQILFYYKSLDIVYADLGYESEKLGEESISFTQEILIRNLEFGYKKEEPILKEINMSIQKGSKVAFIGESGSGKSTLVDIIMGLYKPTEGELLVDNIAIDESNLKSWRSKIGYIPQSVYLFDGTVGENIALGLEYNSHKINSALKRAKIYDFLETKEGEKTLVGEDGVMLSGGQKQRIAIARALYGDPEVLVLDEATSALDDETEKEIMDEIYEICHDKTLIIIAHRLSTIDRCDRVYRLEKGKLIT